MSPNRKNPILCAIDTVDVDAAARIAEAIAGKVGGIKLGKEFFTANGPEAVRRVAGDTPLFLDLKFHDIPNTVAGAVRAAVRAMAPTMLTIHASGGPAMLAAAAESASAAAAEFGVARPLILGVTVLTSLDDDDLHAVGVPGSTGEQAARLAALAQQNGLDGVICSPHEITALRAQCGAGFKLVVPGIRPAGSAAGDQKRIMTPAQAVELGADYLVIGRPISQAADPGAAAGDILASLGPDLGLAHEG
jgi:orotidine-5'-phosphate decarboxylase